jgi:SAM-dependent methyltransferase
MRAQIDVSRENDIVPDRVIPLSLSPVPCCICEVENSEPLGLGEDFEYQTSSDTFLANRCLNCGLVYLSPRPSLKDLSTIYPANYHAFNFSEERFGLVYKVRQRLEAHRALSMCGELSEEARIIDIGCGDGFHLSLLREFGKPGWQLEGVDSDERAVKAAQERGIHVHTGTLESLNLPPNSYDLVFMIQTIEHVDDPVAILRSVRSLLRPGGRVVIMTDNTDSYDFMLFKSRHWGGYHFPRHWTLFNKRTMTELARKVDLDVVEIGTAVSPVNWVYSIRNMLVDFKFPAWLFNRFSLESPVALSAFTALDFINSLAGRGALLHVVLRRPENPYV